jgi:branched-chain amino acid transport system ATP-binding protein
VTLEGKEIHHLAPHIVHKHGLGLVPEGRGIFPNLTVTENLEMGAYILDDKKQIQANIENAFTLFPRLKERAQQKGGTLSGGEQQMLATARGLMSNPKILLMDEPSMGLAPVLVDQIFDIIRELNARGTTILLVEQNALMALSIAHRGYVLQTGQIVLTDTGPNLKANDMVRKAYLGA